MGKSINKIAEERVATLKRRRDFLAKRISAYEGRDSSRDRAEESAIHWAIGVIETHYQDAVDMVYDEKIGRNNESKNI